MTKRVALVVTVPALVLVLAPACTSKDELLKSHDAAADVPIGSGGTTGRGGTGGIPGTGGTGGAGGVRGTGGTGGKGGTSGTGGVITDAGVDAGGCGPGFPTGSSRPAGDGCNSCSCVSSGIWVCSTRPCQAGDASVGGSGGAAGAGGGTGGAAGAAGAGGRGTGGGGGTGGAGGAGGRGTGGGGGTGGATNACLTVQTLDRSCTTAADCFAALNTADCCGRHQYIGLRTTAQTQYTNLEQQCNGTWPACTCVTRPTITDDGSLMRDGMSVGVTCLQGVCTTFVPACGGPCASGLTCFSCQQHLGLFGACTTACNDVDAGSDCPNPALPRCQPGTSGNVDGTYCTTAPQCDQR